MGASLPRAADVRFAAVHSAPSTTGHGRLPPDADCRAPEAGLDPKLTVPSDRYGAAKMDANQR
jgi:hypothetical protein